jgi:hypothetical protein
MPRDLTSLQFVERASAESGKPCNKTTRTSEAQPAGTLSRRDAAIGTKSIPSRFKWFGKESFVRDRGRAYRVLTLIDPKTG